MVITVVSAKRYLITFCMKVSVVISTFDVA